MLAADAACQADSNKIQDTKRALIPEILLIFRLVVK